MVALHELAAVGIVELQCEAPRHNLDRYDDFYASRNEKTASIVSR